MISPTHSDWRHILFYLGLALLAGHELDAVARQEWRLLPLLNTLDDDTGLTVFVLGHIPLFAGLFWATGHRDDRFRRQSQLGFDIFLVLHAVAHFAMTGHALYAFEAPVETITIYGAAMIGLAHIVLLMRR